MKKTLPHCDLETGEIYGCEKNSHEWFHEEGHIMYNKLETTSLFKLVQGYIFYFWIFSVTLAIKNNFMFYFALLMMLIYFCFEVYEERWCNDYAKNMVESDKRLINKALKKLGKIKEKAELSNKNHFLLPKSL